MERPIEAAAGQLVTRLSNKLDIVGLHCTLSPTYPAAYINLPSRLLFGSLILNLGILPLLLLVSICLIPQNDSDQRLTSRPVYIDLLASPPCVERLPDPDQLAGNMVRGDTEPTSSSTSSSRRLWDAHSPRPLRAPSAARQL